MEDRVKEITSLISNALYFCSLDAIEELLPKLKINDINDKDYEQHVKYFKEILEDILPTNIAPDFIKLLISMNFDFYISWSDYGNILNIYINKLVDYRKAGNVEIYNDLLNNGADNTLVDKKGNNILHTLCYGDMAYSTRVSGVYVNNDFIKEIININNIEQYMTENYDGDTPLDLIVKADRLGLGPKNSVLMQYILKLMKEANIEFSDYSKYQLAEKACNIGDVGIMKVLLSDGMDETYKSDDGYSIAHHLVTADVNRFERYKYDLMEKKVEVLKLLTNIDIKDTLGRTPLLLGLQMPSSTIAFWDILIEKGADVNAVDNKGNTALIYAADEAKEAIESLVAIKGIKLDAQNSLGETALMVALSRGNQDAALVLIKAGADVNIIDNKERTALSIASEKGQTKVIEAIMMK